MTAKEMFEELGYKQADENEAWELSFIQTKEYSSNRIDFNKNKTIDMGECCKLPVNAHLNMQLLKAIYQQCKELGWL